MSVSKKSVRTVITEKQIGLDMIAKIIIISTHHCVVNLMMTTFLQTQCAAHAKVRFWINYFRKLVQLIFHDWKNRNIASSHSLLGANVEGTDECNTALGVYNNPACGSSEKCVAVTNLGTSGFCDWGNIFDYEYYLALHLLNYT